MVARPALSEPRMYQCPHCPNEPPYAGASGLWYHMKRHHGAVTRPYNKSKSGAGGKVAKPRTPKKKKDKASKKVKKNHHDDPPLTPGGRSKFPVSPRFKHVHQRRDTEEEDSEDDPQRIQRIFKEDSSKGLRRGFEEDAEKIQRGFELDSKRI